MKAGIITLIIVIIILIAGFVYFVADKKPLENKQKSSQTKDMIKVTSSSFVDNSFISSKYTCKGENINPPILISDVSEDAKSLVLIVDDPDAPGGTFIHWILWNINPKTTEIKENSIPDGASSGKNDFGIVKYQGPCPPSGTHRYFFTIYALDATLNISHPANRMEINKAMKNHVIGQGQLMAKYSKE